jgi:hypothetical protein
MSRRRRTRWLWFKVVVGGGTWTLLCRWANSRVTTQTQLLFIYYLFIGVTTYSCWRQLVTSTFASASASASAPASARFEDASLDLFQFTR